MLKSYQHFKKTGSVPFRASTVDPKTPDSIMTDRSKVFSISSKFRGVLLTSVLRVLADRMIPDDNAYLGITLQFSQIVNHIGH